MGQTGWRLPDDLLKRVRVHCAQTGERQNEFVRQALESALGAAGGMKAPESALPHGGQSSPTSTRTPAKKLAASLGKGFVPPRPKAKGK